MALESPLVITATRFHAPLMQTPVLLKVDNTATSLSTGFSGASLQRAHSIHFFAARIDRYNALWSSPERSFRRDCGRFGWYLRSYREQWLKWLLSRLSTSHRAFLTYFGEGPAGCNNVVSPPSASTYLGSKY